MLDDQKTKRRQPRQWKELRRLVPAYAGQDTIHQRHLFSKHTSDQTFTGLRHDVVVHGILPHVVTNIVSGYFDVFKDRGHLGKLGLQTASPTCFQKFGEQVSEARRARDADPNKKI
jgi:hypothetical protein